MPTFDYQFTVRASLGDVSRFHANTIALKRLTPPPVIVQLHDIEPLGEGSISKFTLWLGPFPIRWTAKHRDVGERGFTDVQIHGPAKRWEHTHTFTPVSDEITRVTEHIEYEHATGRRGLVTRVLFSRVNLRMLFAYRKLMTRWSVRK